MIFVLPSDMEGLSLALLDAMGAGLCVLASDVPENREVVEGAGFTFQAGRRRRSGRASSVPDCESGDSRGGRQKQQESGSKRQYQWRRIAEDIERAYFEILGWKLATEQPKNLSRVRQRTPPAKLNASCIGAG